MTWHKTRPVLISLFTVTIILTVSAAVIAYGRGYRLNLNKPTELNATGIVTATSDPVAAQVLVDGTLKTATNNSFNLAPGWYTVTIRKEGSIPWEKKLRVRGEVVTRADAYLFPTSPSLSPITTSGILAPAVSPDGTTIAYLVPVEAARDGVKKPGLYTLELADRSLGGRNRDPKLVAERSVSSAQSPQLPLSLFWSPDATKIVFLEGTSSTVYDLTRTPSPMTPLTPMTLTSLLSDWQQEQTTRNRQKLAAFKQPFIDVATSSAKILAFSPDETKLLYEATASSVIPPVLLPPMIGTNPTEESRTITPGNLYVYDSREDRNYFLLAKKEIPSTKSEIRNNVQNSNIQNLKQFQISNFKFQISGSPTGEPVWFPTSRHLLLVGSGKIDVMEYDRTNWATLYSGPFDESFVTPWPSGGRLVILTNLNPGASTLPNLYTVNLR